MHINRHFTYLAAAIIAIASLTACHSSKKQVSDAAGYTPAQTEKASTRSLRDNFTDLAASYSDWSDVQMPVKLQIIQPKRISISGQAKMKRDEAILISLRIFGFEVGSVYADKDSVQIYAKAADMYYTESLTKFTERYGLTLGDLQSLMLGRAFTPGGGSIKSGDAGKFEIKAADEITAGNGSAFTITPKSLPKGLSWSYTAVAMPDETPRLSTMAIEATGLAAIDCAFGRTQLTAAGAVASSFEAATVLNKKQFDVACYWTLDNSRWNSGLSLNKPKVSKGAKRVDTAQLLKILKTL